MIRTNKSTKVLSGVFCLPTSSKAHVHEPSKSTAFKPGQYMYLLKASKSVEEGGYPAQVVLTSDAPIEGWEVDSEVETQHAEVRKNLPPRYVGAIVSPDGTVEGDLSTAPKGMGLPHWELISANEDGSAKMGDIGAVKDRIENNKKAAKDAKEAVRNAKKGTPAATETTATA